MLNARYRKEPFTFTNYEYKSHKIQTNAKGEIK